MSDKATAFLYSEEKKWKDTPQLDHVFALARHARELDEYVSCFNKIRPDAHLPCRPSMLCEPCARRIAYQATVDQLPDIKETTK